MDNETILLILILTIIVVVDIVLFVSIVSKKKEKKRQKAREDELMCKEREKEREEKKEKRRRSFEEEKQNLNCRIEYVAQYSDSVKRVERLNRRTGFKQVQEKVEYVHSCSSLKEYEQLGVYKVLSEYAYNNRERIYELEAAVKYNQENMPKYNEAYGKIVENAEKENLGDSFYEIEMKMIESRKLSPITDFEVVLTKAYISPKGKKNYSDSWTFTRGEVHSAIKSYERRMERELKKKTTNEYERSKMTASLRYDVMKRDGFRCAICGRTAEDGVKLHVDHIKPIAKGGKTEIKNLRTLCDICNHGKRDKYDPEGIN